MQDLQSSVTHEVRATFSTPDEAKRTETVSVRPPVREAFVEARLSEKIDREDFTLDRWEVSSVEYVPGQLAAEAIEPGCVLDLEGDEHVNPEGREDLFGYEYPVVTGVEIETPNSVRIHTDMGVFSFPRDHALYVVGQA